MVMSVDSVFQTQQRSCTYELKVVVPECTRPAKGQARENPGMEWSGHKVAPLS